MLWAYWYLTVNVIFLDPLDTSTNLGPKLKLITLGGVVSLVEPIAAIAVGNISDTSIINIDSIFNNIPLTTDFAGL